MRGRTLLRLYPRAWRARYEEEFLALLDDQPMRLGTVVDVISGAIDARLSPAAFRRSERPDEGGAMVLQNLRHACARTRAPFSWWDAGIAAGVLLGGATLFSFLASWLRRQGWPVAADLSTMMAFPGTVVLTLPFLWLKGQSWRAQAVLMTVTLGLLLLIQLGAGTDLF